MLEISDIRELLCKKYKNNEFVIDKSGVKTVEIIGESFLANEESILGEPNKEYIDREIQWYLGGSLNVNDIPGKTPEIWTQVADPDGYINSNYGHLVLTPANGSQYLHVLNELTKNPFSRRGIMIYTRPTMHTDYNKNGMSDFICTNTVQYFIRDGKLHCLVSMRSNDVVYGFRNDQAWQRKVQDDLAFDLDVQVGDIIWNAGSLHIYERHFYLLDHYIRVGETSITKKMFDKLYNE